MARDTRCCVFQVFYDLMREIRAQKVAAAKPDNDKKGKKKKSGRKCVIL